MAFTTLSGTLLKISGSAIGVGGAIAAGTSLTTARLTTIEQDDGPQGQIQINFDAYALTSTESVSVRINGVQIGTTLPQLFTTQITTNAGTFTTLAFTSGGDTYLLPQTGANFGAITTITAVWPDPGKRQHLHGPSLHRSVGLWRKHRYHPRLRHFPRPDYL